VSVAAVDRCLTLIESLCGESEPLEVSVLAQRAGLPLSATHRILDTMRTRGWVTQDAASQHYALSLRLGMLAFRHLDAYVVPDLVQGVLDRLARATSEYCRLAIAEGDTLVWVARAQGATTGLRYEPDIGQEIVLHATANGKAWLATLEEQHALSIVRSRGFKVSRALGPRSIKSLRELRRELKLTRQRGYGASVDEAEAGTAALAVPFYAGSCLGEAAAGTLSVAGPLLRISPSRYEELIAQLDSAAQELSRLWPLRSRQRGASLTPDSTRATAAIREHSSA